MKINQNIVQINMSNNNIYIYIYILRLKNNKRKGQYNLSTLSDYV